MQLDRICLLSLAGLVAALPLACGDKSDDGTSTSASETGGAPNVGGMGGGDVVEAPLVKPQHPNFIILLADDMGFDDFGTNNEAMRTPSLNELASRSVRFDQFYTQPVCATTRAALLTSKMPQEVGVWDVHGGRDFLDLDEELLIERFQGAGYATGVFGKWHSGFSSAYQPQHRGFDEAYTAHLYSHFNNDFLYNGEPFETRGWVTQHLVDLAMNFIDESVAAEKPFVAYVPFLAPHEPWQAPDEFIDPYLEDGMSEELATVLGMVSHLDHHVGRLMTHLSETGIANDTVVFFLSDNGPWKTSSNGMQLDAFDWLDRNPSGLKQNKGEVQENGIRSPLYVHFGEHFQGGDSRALLGVQDIFPTMLDMAGLDVPGQLDGQSFAGVLDEPTADPNAELGERELFFAKHSARLGADQLAWGLSPNKQSLVFEEQILAVRRGPYKLTRAYNGETTLFDVLADPREAMDLSANEPELVTDLTAAMAQRWDTILDDASSFGPGVELIGYDGATESYVSSRTAMNKSDSVTVASWMADGFTSAGAFIEMSVNVRTSGSYAVSVDLESSNASGAEATVSLGGESLTRLIDASDSTSLGGARRTLHFGTVDLPEGTTVLRFEITGEGSETASPYVSRLYGVEFTHVRI